MEFKEGIYENLDYPTYDSIPAWRSHDLTSIAKCPLLLSVRRVFAAAGEPSTKMPTVLRKQIFFFALGSGYLTCQTRGAELSHKHRRGGNGLCEEVATLNPKP